MKMLKGNWRIAAISNKVCTVYVRHKEKMFLHAIGSTLKDCPYEGSFYFKQCFVAEMLCMSCFYIWLQTSMPTLWKTLQVSSFFHILTYAHLQHISLLLFSKSYNISFSSVGSALFCERYQSEAGTDMLFFPLYILVL